MNNLTYLVDICDFQGGTQPPKKQWSKFLKDGYIRMLQIRDFTQFEKVEPEYVKYSTKLKTCKSDDILIARYGASLGKILTGLSGAYNVAIMKTIPNENKITKKYLYYYFLSDSFQNTIKNFGSRAAQAGFNKEDLSLIKLKCPSIEKQEEQCLVLNYIYNLIDKRRRQILLLDKLVKSRFIEMFGSLGSDKFGWGLMKLGNCCEINPSKINDNRLKENLYVSFIPMSCVTDDGKITEMETKTYDEVKSGFTYFKEGDVLFAKITPCMENGKGAIAIGLYNKVGFGSTEFHVLRPIKEKCNSYWLYMVTMFSEFRLIAESNMTGSAGQKRVPVSFLENFKISVPSIELQNEFADFFKQTDKSKFVNYKCLQTVANIYRQEWMRCQTSNF